MIKAFLSHSNKDKGGYVEKVANLLGKDKIVYDEFTFEEGEKSFDEIIHGLDKSDLFVLFLSNNALESEWVIREIREAKIRLNESEISKFFPIIIEDGLTYEDKRIPEWLRNSYNLKPIKRSHVAARRIHNKLRELSWSRHPELKKRQTLFVGRNDKLEEFEQRIHDFELEKPLVIVASGITGVGRRTFLHRALCKTNIAESSHKPSAIVLDHNVSIEDFILKINDLGLVDLHDEVLSLTNKSVKEKILIIHKIMDASYSSREIIYLVDDGCLVNYKREISPWYLETISTYNSERFPIFCLASKYNVNFKNRPRNKRFYCIELNELSPNERKRLLTQLLEIYKIKIEVKDFNDISELLFGLPDQIMFAIDLLREDNNSSISVKLPILTDYNSAKASVLLRKYDRKEEILDFIRLLAQFEVISSDFIFQIVSVKKFYPILEQLAAEHIIELIGIDGEIIRLNDVIRDYISRNKLKVRNDYIEIIKTIVVKLWKSDDLFELDSSEYIFTLKESLKEGYPIDEKLLIPSHYLRCMEDLYHNKGNLDRIIELADIILQKSSNLDFGVVQDIRYFLCLALARKIDRRMLKEVEKIHGNQRIFLLGFYYRLSGRYKEALEKFNSIINAPYVNARAKREIVQVYLHLEEYDKALAYARSNYNENRENQFHTQAYYYCLINSEKRYKHKNELKHLLDNLRAIDSDQSNEMADIADALFCAKIEDNMVGAIDKIEDCVDRYPESHYPLLTLCDIALKYKDKNLLKKGCDQLLVIYKKKQIQKRIINKYKAFYLAMEGNQDDAIKLINRDIQRYPKKSMDRLIAKIISFVEK